MTNAALLCIGIGIGWLGGGMIALAVECWDKYQTRKLAKEWRC